MTDLSSFLHQIVHVVIDRPMGSRHTEFGFEYPVNYGYLPGVPAPDGEDLDAYVLVVVEPLKSFWGKCIAVIHRTNDEDDKLVVVPVGSALTNEEIRRFTNFQEQFFESEIIR